MLVNQFRRTLVIFLADLALINALLQNVTVDDADTTGVVPQYLPPSAWSQGATCTGCLAHPDPAQASGGTWHDATFTPGDGIAKAIELDFNGTAIYVFFILANTIEFVDTVTDVDFIIDELPVGSFVHNPSASTDFQYNVPVYVNESLSNVQHHIRMEAAGNRSALILFDYLIYTSNTEAATSSISSTLASTTLPTTAFPSETQTHSDATNLGSIIGGAVAGVIAATLLGCALLCYWRRKKRKPTPDRIVTQEAYGDAVSLSDSERDTANVTPFAVPQQRMLASLDRMHRPDHQRLYSDIPALRETVTLFTESQPESSSQSRTTRSSEINSGYKEHPSSHGKGPEASRLGMVETAPSSRSPPTDETPTNGAGLLREQVERLMDEVVRLRHLHVQDTDGLDLESEAPPGYSEGHVSPDTR